MGFPDRLILLSSICQLVFLSALFFCGFISLGLYLLFFFSTISICCCLLAFNLRQKQRPATVLIHTSSVSTNTFIIPSSSSSSSSPPSGKLTYDVFLSFRGIDTRKNFTDHLYTALKQRGIFTFRDDEELERGESIGPNLLKAIEESRYVIVVFSRNYADSAWCLDEIAKVADCMKATGQTVLPVFYDVDPSEVRRQTGDHFGKAFEKHQKRCKAEPDKVKRWKDALFQISNLSGWHLQDGYESKVIQEVVEKIFTELNRLIPISEGLVGMDSHLNEMLSYLDIGCPDVRIIGICGMGGIGKTTIAQVVFERVQTQFEGCSFLENVREVIEKQGAVHLQEQLLSNLLRISNVNVQNIKVGKDRIRRRLRTKMVLIILDDVDQEEQLEALCDRRWFGPGSRIIITSRDEHLLTAFGADIVYKVNPLTDVESLQLFSLKAFKKDQVGEDFLKLSKEFLNYADGLPLAIKVLGSFLHGRRVKLWSSTLDRIKENPEKKVIDVLKVSFDGLQETEKKIFLDIACFFKGEDVDRVIRILKGSGHCPDIDIEVLVEKSMITLFGRKLVMHDLIQELGREIVRQECREQPGKRSRLWLPNEIFHVLDHKKATSAVESISLLGPTKDSVVHTLNDSFSNMDRLRLLQIWNVEFSGNIKYLSRELQFLQWHDCPFDSFPSDFAPDKLVEIQLHSSRIEHLWRGEKGWSMLRHIDLSGSQYLMSTPDFTEVPDLEMLVLQDCTSLVEVHPSLGFLKKLHSLNMRNCKSVESIPPFNSLESLQTLIISFCSRLKKFPEIKGNMKSLLELHLDGTSIEELPPSIERLTSPSLTMLNLADCKSLLHIPSTIQCLTSLKSLYLTGCSKLDQIPANLNCVESLLIDGTAIRDLSFLVGMKKLKYLSCRECKGLASEPCKGLAALSSLSLLVELDLSDCNLMDVAIPNDLSSLISLRKLCLGGNSFVRLPESISKLSKLEFLVLSNCRQLQLVPKLPSSVHYVLAEGCTSLIDFPNQFKILTSLESGVTTINSLNSTSTSALREPEMFKQWDFSGNGHAMRLRTEKTAWKQVDQISLPVILKELEFFAYSSPSCRDVLRIDNEIPEGFSTISRGNFISIPIPPNLRDDNEWKGIAACAVFSLKGHYTSDISVVEPDPEVSRYFYQCTLETDIFRKNPSIFDIGEQSRFLRSSSHLLLISYLASGQFPKRRLNESTVMKARFETNDPFMEVQKCGIRLHYQQDAEWFTKLFSAPCERLVYLTEDDGGVLESGWLSQVDKCLKWEPCTSACEQDSTILLRKNFESVLLRYLEALKHKFIWFSFNLSGSPAWLNSDTKLPRNLRKSKKWMGFAIYASIVEEQRHMIQEKYYLVHLQLKLGESYIPWSGNFCSSEVAHQLLIFYIPRAQIPEVFMQTSPNELMDISFRTDSPQVKIQSSGMRIVYQEDIQGFVETIIRCMRRQREDTLELFDRWVVGEWIKLIRLQSGLESIYTSKVHDSKTRRGKKFELLSQKYRNWGWSAEPPFGCFFYGKEISKGLWFKNFNEGNTAEIQLPPNLFDNANWLGIAVCALGLRSHRHSDGSLDTPDLQYNMLSCYLDSDVACSLFDVKVQQLIRKLEPWEFVSDFTWFSYIPHSGKYFKFWRQCKRARVTYSSSSPGLGMHSCAFRLVFKEDVEHLIQTLTLCELP